MQGDGLLRVEAEAHAVCQQDALRPGLHGGGPHDGAHLVQLIDLQAKPPQLSPNLIADWKYAQNSLVAELGSAARSQPHHACLQDVWRSHA